MYVSNKLWQDTSALEDILLLIEMLLRLEPRSIIIARFTMTFDLDAFAEKFASTQRYLESVLLQGQQADTSDILSEAMATLSSTLEELHVVSEELNAQTEELTASNQMLAAERRRYRELFEFAPYGYLVTDLQGIIREANRTAATLLNIPTRTLIGKPLSVLVAIAEHHQFYSLLNQLQNDPSLQHVELTLTPRGSLAFVAAFTVAAFRDRENQRNELRWAFRDLTELTLARAALERSEAKYRAMIQDQTELVCQFSGDGTLGFVNTAFCRYFAREEADLLGTHFLDHIRESDRPSVQAQLDIRSQCQSAGTIECRTLPLNAQDHWIEWRIRAIFDERGRFLMHQAVGRDTSSQKEYQTALERSETQLRLITDALPALVTYIDPNERYRFVNQTYETWFARTREGLGNSDIRDLLGPGIYAELQAPLQSAFSGEKVTYESEWRCGNGLSRDVNVSLIPYINSTDTVMGVVSLVIDITERKVTDRLKEEFLATVSHELRTPLTSIHGSLKLLATGRLGSLAPDGEDMLTVADENCDRLVRLIGDLLDFQRLESDSVPMRLQVWDAGEAIERAADELRSIASDCGITLKTFPTALPIYADPDYLMQTLTNLIGNSIKFSAAGSTIYIRDREWDDGTVLFSVEDRGQGIPSDHLESIFERFHQLDASTTRPKGGTGLGLAICRSIVKQHGGQIWAESTLGQGSTFYFTIPSTQPSACLPNAS